MTISKNNLCADKRGPALKGAALFPFITAVMIFSWVAGVHLSIKYPGLQTILVEEKFLFQILQGILILLGALLLGVSIWIMRHDTRQQPKSISTPRENEEWLRLSTETAGVATWEYDLVKNHITRSPNHEHLYGMEPQEAWTVDTFRNALHPDDVEFAIGTLEQSVEDGGPDKVNLDFRTIWPDQSVHWLALTGEITRRDSAGRGLHMRGCLLDITDRKKTEEKLKASETRFKALFEQAGDYCMILDPNTGDGIPIIVDANRAAYTMHGYTREEFIGRPVADMDDAEGKRLCKNHTLKIMEGGTFSIENTHLRKDGSTFNVRVHASRIDIKGEAPLIFTTEYDITDQKKTEKALQASEERFRLIFENAPVLMNSFSEEGKCLLWNKQCRETFGWTIDEVNAHSDPLALFYPDPMVRARAAKSVTKDPDGHFKEWQPLTKDGRTLTTTWANFRLPTGMVFSLGHDITELKQTREALLKEKNRLQFALEVCNTGAWDLNLKDHSSYRTAGHDRIFGYENPLTEWTYEMFLEHVVPEDREETDRKFQHAIAHQCDWNFECRIRRQDGEIRWIWAVGRHGSPVDGNQNFMVGVVQDITERKQTEVELQKAHDSLERRVMERTSELKIRQEEAEALNRAMINVLQDLKSTNSELENAKSALLTSNKELEAFSYSVSHDLRAPLRAINGFVEILLEDYGEQLDTEGKRVCAVISDSAHDMGKLIDDLLSFSRIGRVALQPQEVDMEALVRNVYSELSTNENPQRIDFRVDPLPTAVGDPKLLRQVWINLIGNAVKFSSQKEQALIEVRAEPLADEIVYSIRDNGAGFDPQYADKLFGVFQRLHSTEEFEGTGVGLAIVQHIVQRHGGRTWAKAKPDEGATIYFTLKKENNHDQC